VPLHSQSQWGFAFAAEARGELPPGTAERWARASAPYLALPAHAAVGFFTPGPVHAYQAPIEVVAGSPTGLPSAWPPSSEPEPAPTPPAKPRRRLSPLAAAGVAVAAVGVALAFASRWAR